MSNILDQAQRHELAATFGFEHKSVSAVTAVESSGSGFDKATGKILIQFEPYWFKYYSGVAVPNGVENQVAEWKAFNIAFAKNPQAALMATSWGLGQIMGFNHKKAGYKTVNEMVDAFKESEYNQLKGMLTMISTDKYLQPSLINKKWDKFAYYYNGPQYVKYDYANRLERAYNQAAA